jgi:adenosylcobinamide-GDP ribazoletransferase
MRNEYDNQAWHPGDLALGFELLTRLPVSGIFPKPAPGRLAGQSAWAWPLVGIATGLAGGLSALFSYKLGLPPLFCASIAVGVQTLLTGALHEDGLADMADGFWGGHQKERRLEIMKDSRIGAYGVIALILAFLLRVSALSSLMASGWVIAPILAAAILSRLPMVLLMAHLPNARGTGLSDMTGRPSRRTALHAGFIAALLTLALVGWLAITTVLAVSAVTYLLARLSLAKIGGQTGDVLGASQQLTEITALAVLSASLT